MPPYLPRESQRETPPSVCQHAQTLTKKGNQVSRVLLGSRESKTKGVKPKVVSSSFSLLDLTVFFLHFSLKHTCCVRSLLLSFHQRQCQTEGCAFCPPHCPHAHAQMLAWTHPTNAGSPRGLMNHIHNVTASGGPCSAMQQKHP